MKLISKSHIVACIFIVAITLGSDYSLFASEVFAQTPTPAAQAPAQTPVANNQSTVVSGSAQRREYTLLEPLPCVNGPEGTATEGITCEGGYVKKVNLYGILGYAYRLLLAIASILAVVMIMYGGVQYMTTEAFTGKSAAKETIKNAVIGLFMTLGSFLFLQTIDPKITELAEDPLPLIGVDREYVINPQTLQQLLNSESERIRNTERLKADIDGSNEETTDALADVSKNQGKTVSEIETAISYAKKDNADGKYNEAIKKLEKDLVVAKRAQIVSKYDNRAIEKFIYYVDGISLVEVPEFVNNTSTPWNQNEPILNNNNSSYVFLNISSRYEAIAKSYESAFSEMANQNDVEGGKIIRDRRNIITSLTDFARDTVDLEKRYEKYAVRVATQGARPTAFATANQAKLQGLINGITTRTTNLALEKTFGPDFAKDITAQFYKKNMELYRQRLENIKATYK